MLPNKIAKDKSGNIFKKFRKPQKEKKQQKHAKEEKKKHKKSQTKTRNSSPNIKTRKKNTIDNKKGNHKLTWKM